MSARGRDPRGRLLVGDSAPSDGEPVSDLHADADRPDLTPDKPSHFVELAGAFNLKVVLVGELPALEVVANVVAPGETLLRTASRLSQAAPGVLVRPARVESSRGIAPRVQGETDVRAVHRPILLYRTAGDQACPKGTVGSAPMRLIVAR